MTERESGGGKDPKLLGQAQASGAEVVGSDGEKIGDLKAVRDADFLVDRRFRRDLYVPVRHVREISADEKKVVLDVPAGGVDDMGWEKGWPKPPSVLDPDVANFSESPESEEEPRKGSE